MFKLDDNEEIIIKNWPVIINIPQDGGTTRAHQINADFLLLPQDKYNEQLEISRDSDSGADTEMLRRVVKRLDGVADADGKPLDYTPDLLDKMLKKAFVRSALFDAYNEANSGKKAKRKN